MTSVTDKDEIYRMVVEILHDMFELDKSRLTPDANLFLDLDIDSIDAVDLVVKLNEMTGKRIQPEIFKSVRKIDDVVNAIADLLMEKTV